MVPANSQQPLVSMSPSDLATQYLRLFADSDVDGLYEILDSEFVLEGPISTFANRDEYIRSLRESPPQRATINVLDVCASQDTVAVFYRYHRHPCPITIAQLFRCNETSVVSSRLVFDASLLPPD